MRKLREDRLSLFEELVEEVKYTYEAAGIAIAMVDASGECLYEKCWGYRDAENGLAINEQTVFGLASITKSFTCLALMQLAQTGAIQLDDPVSLLIPAFTNQNQQSVRLWHLMCHSGGFYPLPRILVDQVAQEMGLDEAIDGDLAYHEGLAAYGCKLVAERLDRQTPESGLIGRPGEYLSYCNDGFGLLSEVVRRRGGELSYAQYVKRHILEPLGMDRSGCDYVWPQTDPNASLLYKKVDGVMRATRDYHDNAFVLCGGGAMKSTLRDMQKYVVQYLNDGVSADGTRVVDGYGVREMIKPRQSYRFGSWYGYGLSTKAMEDFAIVEHGGSLTGVSSNMAWSYELGAGVIVLCNTSQVPVSILSDAAMRLLSERDPLPRRDLHIVCGWEDGLLEAACGVYRSGEGHMIEIFKDDSGKAALMIGGKCKQMIPIQRTVAIIRNGMQDTPLQLHFDDDERVFAIRYGGRMIPREPK